MFSKALRIQRATRANLRSTVWSSLKEWKRLAINDNNYNTIVTYSHISIFLIQYTLVGYTNVHVFVVYRFVSMGKLPCRFC